MNRNQLSAGSFENYKHILLYRRLSPFELSLNVGMSDALAYLDDVAGVPGFEGDYIALLTEASLREMPDSGARFAR